MVVFGDSWPRGAELNDPLNNAFPTLIGKQLNLEIINLAEAASSTDQAVYQFLKNIDLWKNKHTAVLFCLTSIARSMYFDASGKINEIHPTRSDLPSLNYYIHIYSEQLGKTNQIKNVLLVQSVCKQFDVPVFFVTNWNDLPDHVLIDQEKIYKKSLFEIIGLTNINSESNGSFLTQLRSCDLIKPNFTHPNEKGHQIIASELSIWLKENL